MLAPAARQDSMRIAGYLRAITARIDWAVESPISLPTEDRPRDGENTTTLDIRRSDNIGNANRRSGACGVQQMPRIHETKAGLAGPILV